MNKDKAPSRSLNLGCGNKPMPDWLNVDCRDLPGVDEVWDLNCVPWPSGNRKFDEVQMMHTLEHVDDPVAALREIARLLSIGGKATVVVPHAHSYLACYPGHKTMFGKIWFECLRDSSCNQDDVTLRGCDVAIELRLWHYSVTWSRFWNKLWRGIERVLNKTEQRQRFWEASGILPPAEIWVTITKERDVEDFRPVIETCQATTRPGTPTDVPQQQG